ncbi:MAG: chemotaxis protein CheC [Gemmatimonadetes bacterium]|nr:chemotaxis protein CheC [Gemmatimonadota bacterium]
MQDVRDLEEIQFDALREVANMGAGHAATALSQMTNSRIMVNVPRLQVARLENVPGLIGDPEMVVAAVMMHLLGDLTGRTLLIFPQASAVRLAEILLNRQPGSGHEFGELEQSAIKEAGNILCAAYVNALSEFMGMMILPSVPSLAIEQCAAVLTTAYSDYGSERDYVFSIETQFTMSGGEAVEGHFLLLPDIQSLQAILRAVRLA